MIVTPVADVEDDKTRWEDESTPTIDGVSQAFTVAIETPAQASLVLLVGQFEAFCPLVESHHQVQ